MTHTGLSFVMFDPEGFHRGVYKSLPEAPWGSLYVCNEYLVILAESFRDCMSSLRK